MQHSGMFLVTASLLLLGCETTPTTMTSTTAPQAFGPDHHILHMANDIPWQDGPGSLEEGAEFAVLEGDPSEPGLFTMQLKLPDDFAIAPHTHPRHERVTVISGTFLLGHGAEADPDEVDVMEPGSYTTMPPGMQHYAFADGETVIQLTSMGPWEINYINPADDPRQR